MHNLLIIGSGGHAVSCIDVIEEQKVYKITGTVSEPITKENKKIKYPNIGIDSDLPRLYETNKNAFIGIGFIKSSHVRESFFYELKKIGFNLPVIISPILFMSKNSSVDEGSIMMHNSLINSNASVGKNCIINTGAIIEHESIVGDHSHISTSVVVNGGAIIGKGCFIGSKSVIKEGVRIGDNCIVSAGSFLKKDLKSGLIYN